MKDVSQRRRPDSVVDNKSSWGNEGRFPAKGLKVVALSQV